MWREKRRNEASLIKKERTEGDVKTTKKKRGGFVTTCTRFGKGYKGGRCERGSVYGNGLLCLKKNHSVVVWGEKTSNDEFKRG